jgi:hypothetical protein
MTWCERGIEWKPCLQHNSVALPHLLLNRLKPHFSSRKCNGRLFLTQAIFGCEVTGLAPGETKEPDLSFLDFGLADDISADGRTLLEDLSWSNLLLPDSNELVQLFLTYPPSQPFAERRSHGIHRFRAYAEARCEDVVWEVLTDPSGASKMNRDCPLRFKN